MKERERERPVQFARRRSDLSIFDLCSYNGVVEILLLSWIVVIKAIMIPWYGVEFNLKMNEYAELMHVLVGTVWKVISDRKEVLD